ncbi:Oidioi.mRNA.OKI2018_I69.chr1.g1169.t1.cds [Oikopleura dioica]|uniref:Oidioi.mRNA.OKI2018_I69.chr1.g1169.t1.cds n=1 Tax=Oikopleura dioica TaxID=34765 RepID=A0ABN7SNT4_OIKDI|nr:Oidioi.mRNA.OKI2018_I69.chr1.g1169.t1.cds [Oikopleura dioica]
MDVTKKKDETMMVITREEKNDDSDSGLDSCSIDSQRNSSEESSPAQSPKLSEKKEVLTQAPVKLIKQSVKLEEIRSTWTGRRRRVPRLGVSALSSKPKMGAENFSNKKLFHISSKEKQYKSN